MNRLGSCVIGVVACAAMVAATAPGSTSNSEGRAREAIAGSTVSSASSAAPGQSVTRLDEALRALGTAERAIPGSKAYDIETDTFRGQRVWEVKVARGVTRPFELDVRADGRVVVRQRRSATIDLDVRKLAQARITLQRALRTAASRAGGGRFHEADIDRWRSRIVWEVTFKRSGGREVEVKIDARTGGVLAVEVDD